jgi:superoxide reductase
MKNLELFRCEECGNIVVLVKKGGGTLSCCSQEMKKLEANKVDASKEKHVPVVTKENGKIRVEVGSTLHPMLPEHYIEWIALVTENRTEFKYLEPGEKPIAEFDDAESGTVFEYCNLHGLWSTEF